MAMSIKIFLQIFGKKHPIKYKNEPNGATSIFMTEKMKYFTNINMNLP